MVKPMVIPKGYKQTDVGVIPNDWNVNELQNLVNITTGAKNTQDKIDDGDYPFFVRSQTVEKINSYSFDGEAVLTAGDGVGTGKIFHYIKGKFDYHQRVYKMSEFSDKIDGYYFYLYFSQNFYNRIMQMTAKSSVDSVRREMIANMQIPLPPTKAEQIAIAEVLSDTDNLITALEKLIVKKQNIKQGVMQKLLTPKEDWEVKKLGEVCDVLDNLRVPLNEGQRTKMKGEIPYCGANGIVDYVNDYVVNDDILLMAEDGGYFDEYQTRPIAYRMSGKCWVNNHAHILKSKKWICQNFIYYSIVHKNILDYINSGTRAKLNKSDLVSIQISLPKTKEEQTRIATILSDMDKEIKGLKTKLEKTKMIKQGMMQELLTGRTRLV